MSLPDNMRRVTLPIKGLATGDANAVVTWNPGVSFDSQLLVVLFFHGLEDNPQSFALTHHRLPEQVAAPRKNVILVAPTMHVSGSVNTDYLASFGNIVSLVEEAVLAAGAAAGEIVERADAQAAILQAKLHLVAYSNGHVAWSRVIKTLRSSPQAATVLAPIGHSLFDCLYWSTPLMDGAEHVPTEHARFSNIGRAIPQSAFITTHFTSNNETLSRAKALKVMIENEPTFQLHEVVPARLDARNIVLTHLPTPNHDEAVSSRRELSRVISAVPGCDLPASPSA